MEVALSHSEIEMINLREKAWYAVVAVALTAFFYVILRGGF